MLSFVTLHRYRVFYRTEVSGNPALISAIFAKAFAHSVSLCHSFVLSFYGLYSPWNSPGQDAELGSLCLLQGIFLTQGSNRGLLHGRRILYQLSYEGRPDYTSIKKKKKKVKLDELASRWHNEQAAYNCQTLLSFQTRSWPLS